MYIDLRTLLRYRVQVEVAFADDDLCQLDTDPSFRMGLSADVVRAYRKRMQQIRSAVDERDLRALNLRTSKSWMERGGANIRCGSTVSFVLCSS